MKFTPSGTFFVPDRCTLIRTKGVRAIQRACPFTVALEINSPCFKDFVPNRCTLYQGTCRRREIMNSGSAIGKCLCVRFSTCTTLRAGATTEGCPYKRRVGADPCVCPHWNTETVRRSVSRYGYPRCCKWGACAHCSACRFPLKGTLGRAAGTEAQGSPMWGSPCQDDGSPAPTALWRLGFGAGSRGMHLPAHARSR